MLAALIGALRMVTSLANKQETRIGESLPPTRAGGAWSAKIMRKAARRKAHSGGGNHLRCHHGGLVQG